MKVFIPRTIKIYNEENRTQNDKELKSYLKNNYSEFFNKKKLTYYTTDTNKLIITTFEDTIPQLSSEETTLVPIYNICRHFIDLDLNEERYSYFAITEYKVVVVFKNEELIDYQKIDGDINEIDLFITRKKKSDVTSSKFKSYVYSDHQLVNNEVNEIIDLYSKDIKTHLEKEDILFKKNGLQKILGKVNIELNIRNLLKTILVYGTITGSVYFLYSTFEKSNKLNTEMMNNISLFSKNINKLNTEMEERFKRLESLEKNINEINTKFEEVNKLIKENSNVESVNLINTKLQSIENILKEVNNPQNKQPVIDIQTLKQELSTGLQNSFRNELGEIKRQFESVNNQPNFIQNSMSKTQVQEVIQKELTKEEQFELDQKKMIQEINSYQIKVKFQSKMYIKVSQGRMDYRLYNLTPIEIRGYKVLYSMDLNNITFIKDEKKVSFKIINNQLVVDKTTNEK